MPVRIYDIAKKLGIESKEVLVKAKDLGITGARVPSSSLDKITAEFLEQELAKDRPAPPPPPPPPHPVLEPIVVVTAPAALAPEPTPAGVVPLHPTEISPPQGTDQLVTDAGATPQPATLSEPPAVAATPTPQPPAPESPATSEPVASVAPPVETPAAPLAPPPPPAVPAVPRIGEKIGFIKLPPRPAPRTADKTPPARPVPGRPAPGRPEPARGRFDNRGGRPDFAGAPTSQTPAGRGATPGRPEAARTPAEPKIVLPADSQVITLKPPIIVRDLAEQLRRKPFQVIADLMEFRVIATVNQGIEETVAERICAKYGYRFELEKRERGGGIVHAPVRKVDLDIEDKLEDLTLRAPVVTIMGHVDHGKTTLLDVIRKSNVAAGEAGGITQHIGAYTISFPHPERKKELQQITFLDTPGHAAFSSMRARGANVTDIVVLVVAANDGVMPQTLEALSHALAAKVPIIVAVNKIDHPNSNPMKVRQQLQDRGLVPDDWGGDTIFVDVSGITKQGVDKLLEMILLQADLLELKANPLRRAKGNVIESGLEPGGPVATVLVRKGTLKTGDVVICGSFYGRIRALINAEGKRIKEAGPSVAVKLLGMNGIPEAGLEFSVVEDDKGARELAEQREEQAKRQARGTPPQVTLEDLLKNIEAGKDKVLKVVVKADTQGSEEAIVEALEKLPTDKVALEVIHSAVGTITETDVQLSSASHAIILGFHTRIDNGVSELSKRQGVQIKLYTIIYELIDEVKDAMSGLLDPVIREVVTGSAEVRKVITLSSGGNVAGCVVSTGRIVRGKVRIMRRKNPVYEGVTQSLRRFQEDVNEIRAGMECGIRVEGFNDFQVGDAIECYTTEKVASKL